MPDDRSGEPRPAATLGGDATGGVDAPADLRRAFWTLVALLNVALLATALGLMLVAFEGRAVEGGASLLVGLVASALALRRYRGRNA